MTFDDYDKLCVMAQKANPDSKLSVTSYDAMQITFRWRWRQNGDELLHELCYCFHIGELEAAGLTISDDCVTEFTFAECARCMQSAQ